MPIERVAHRPDRRRLEQQGHVPVRQPHPRSCRATPRRPVEKIEVSPLRHHLTRAGNSLAPAIDFPDIARAPSKSIVAFVILYDEQTPQPVRAALSEGMQS
jgi:hypothetical protein